jgi:putative peptidoglycan binding protein/glycosyl hydrolase family 46
MARVLFARGVSGEIIKKIQRRLTALSFDTKGIDGFYGNDTRDAVLAFQGANSLAPTGEVDVTTWEKLMETPILSVRDRSLQLTSTFEGHGFTLAQGNFDGAGVTWGVIGFTLSGGELSKFILQINKQNPQFINQAFGGEMDELIKIMGAPQAQQLLWADRISLGVDKVTLAEPWLSAFQKFGEIEEVQALQLELADRDYFQPAVQTAKEFGLKTELGLALSFDIHVQNGGISPSAREEIEDNLAAHPVTSEQELRVIIANAVANNAKKKYREDVRSRKLTIATGSGQVHGATFVLRNWGLDESPFSV